MQKQTLIFVGRSGCGKGTQAQKIIDLLEEKDSREVLYVETGESFRNFMKSATVSSALAKEVYDAGGLQPEFLAVWAWAHLFVEKMKEDQHVIIDGTPRRAHEAPVLDSAVQFYKREKPAVVHVNVSADWSRTRLMERGRSDDNRDDIDERMRWFETDVVPAINFFRTNPNYNFVEVDGERPIDEIHADIVSRLGIM